MTTRVLVPAPQARAAIVLTFLPASCRNCQLRRTTPRPQGTAISWIRLKLEQRRSRCVKDWAHGRTKAELESCHMNNLSIKGIVLGTIAVFVIEVTLGFMLGFGASVLSVDLISEETLKAGLKTNTGLLWFGMVSGTLSNVVGGYIAARLAKEAIYLNSGMIGMIIIVIGLLSGGEYPLWFTVIAYISTLPSALLGGYLAGLRQPSYA
jgi:hypothetical protein